MNMRRKEMGRVWRKRAKNKQKKKKIQRNKPRSRRKRTVDGRG